MQQFDFNRKLLKEISFFLLGTFLFVQSNAQVFPMDTIMRNGHRNNRINMAYLSDGYQSAELATFVTNATTINNALFSQAPFSQYKNYFNSFTIKVPSTNSGALHPRTGSDCPSLATQPIASPTTYFQSTFDYFAIHRLLVPQNNAAVSSVLASNVPDFDQAMVVVNSPYYGGSGGTWATASTEANSTEVAIHEIGHSFAGLADEYWAGDFYAAERPNMTANNNPATVKWKNWIGLNGIGIYAVGTTAGGTTWYRPHQNCKMQFLGAPFCSVCSERLIDRVHQLVNMADAMSPTTNAFTLANTDPVNFSVTAVQNNPSTISARWYLNGSSTPFATNQFNVTVPFSSFTAGTNTVRAELIDNTSLSKSYLPGVGYINNVTWTITNSGSLPVKLKGFTGKVENYNGVLNWDVETPEDLQHFELEKSKDGSSFSKLATINGESQRKNFAYTDVDLLSPYTFYRLKVVEKNGSNFYSPVIRLQSALEKYNYKVYQESNSRKYHLSVRMQQPQKVSMEITDISGRRISRKDFGKVASQLDFDFNLSGKAAGIYFMNLIIDNQKYTVQLVAN